MYSSSNKKLSHLPVYPLQSQNRWPLTQRKKNTARIKGQGCRTSLVPFSEGKRIPMARPGVDFADETGVYCVKTRTAVGNQVWCRFVRKFEMPLGHGREGPDNARHGGGPHPHPPHEAPLHQGLPAAPRPPQPPLKTGKPASPPRETRRSPMRPRTNPTRVAKFSTREPLGAFLEQRRGTNNGGVLRGGDDYMTPTVNRCVSLGPCLGLTKVIIFSRGEEK